MEQVSAFVTNTYGTGADQNTKHYYAGKRKNVKKKKTCGCGSKTTKKRACKGGCGK